MAPYLGWGSAASTYGKQASRESEVNDLLADVVLARSVVADALGDGVGVVALEALEAEDAQHADEEDALRLLAERHVQRRHDPVLDHGATSRRCGSTSP